MESAGVLKRRCCRHEMRATQERAMSPLTWERPDEAAMWRASLRPPPAAPGTPKRTARDRAPRPPFNPMERLAERLPAFHRAVVLKKNPRVSFGGGQFFATWDDGKDGCAYPLESGCIDIYGAFVDPATGIAGPSFATTRAYSCQEGAASIFNGTNFLVLHSDERLTNCATADLTGERVTPFGVVLDVVDVSGMVGGIEIAMDPMGFADSKQQGPRLAIDACGIVATYLDTAGAGADVRLRMKRLDLDGGLRDGVTPEDSGILIDQGPPSPGVFHRADPVVLATNSYLIVYTFNNVPLARTVTFASCDSCLADSDLDGTVDCVDGCPEDPDKIEPGECGCGVPDDEKWTALDGGGNGSVIAITSFDDGSGAGPALYAAGDFTSMGGVSGTKHIARWNGSTWTSLAGGVNDGVFALLAIDAGTPGGPALYAGGYFTQAGGRPASRVARWNGSEWSAVGSGLNGAVLALASFQGGIYAGGQFSGPGGSAWGTSLSRLARWNGSTWASVGGGVNGPVWALAGVESNAFGSPRLFVGGEFTVAGGGTSANRVAAWNGQWSALGSGTTGWVRALAVVDHGPLGGVGLYAGGQFNSAGHSANTRNLARWNGAWWSSIGGANGMVRALAGIDSGSTGGPALLAGGEFSGIGGVPASRVARSNGLSWSALDAGVNGSVRALAAASELFGDPSAVFAGGNFSATGPMPLRFIGRWAVECGVNLGGSALDQSGLEIAAGDLDGDGDVDRVDLAMLLAYWGLSEIADVDRSGIVDAEDLVILLDHWTGSNAGTEDDPRD